MGKLTKYQEGILQTLRDDSFSYITYGDGKAKLITSDNGLTIRFNNYLGLLPYLEEIKMSQYSHLKRYKLKKENRNEYH